MAADVVQGPSRCLRSNRKCVCNSATTLLCFLEIYCKFDFAHHWCWHIAWPNNDFDLWPIMVYCDWPKLCVCLPGSLGFLFHFYQLSHFALVKSRQSYILVELLWVTTRHCRWRLRLFGQVLPNQKESLSLDFPGSVYIGYLSRQHWRIF